MKQDDRAEQSHLSGNKIEPPKVTVFRSPEAGIFSNAYLIETSDHVVALDTTLLESTSNALRKELENLHKPLAAVLITHGHPDHYNGVTNLLKGDSVDVIATRAVYDVIREYDSAKEKQWSPVFQAEWPKNRTFPNRLVLHGESIQVDGVLFSVHDLGPGESHADSYWTVEAEGKFMAFIGDVVLEGVHAYTSDGHTKRWLENISRLSDELKHVDIIYPGHGEPGGIELLKWQQSYLELYRSTVAKLAQGNAKLTDEAKQQLVARMEEYLPNKRLEFLIALGADAVAAELREENKDVNYD